MRFVAEALHGAEFEVTGAVAAKQGQAAIEIAGCNIHIAVSIEIRRKEREQTAPALLRHGVSDGGPEGAIPCAEPHHDRPAQASRQRIRVAVAVYIIQRERARLRSHRIGRRGQQTAVGGGEAHA